MSFEAPSGSGQAASVSGFHRASELLIQQNILSGFRNVADRLAMGCEELNRHLRSHGELVSEKSHEQSGSLIYGGIIVEYELRDSAIHAFVTMNDTKQFLNQFAAVVIPPWKRRDEPPHLAHPLRWRDSSGRELDADSMAGELLAYLLTASLDSTTSF